MDLTPKQQTSEAIRQSESILITTGQHPSVDQVSAVIALAMILRKFGKTVSAVVTDNLPQAVQLLDTASIDRNLAGMRDFILKVDTSKAEVGDTRTETANDKFHIYLTPRKGGFAPSDVTFDYGEASLDYDLVIILGVPTRARIDRIYEQNQDMFARIPIINLDFHRSNESYGAVNLIEPNASSLCEMLVALAESLQGGIIDDQIATALLMGIVGSTDRFTASHTTSKSLTVAAQMMAAGAKQQAVVKALYRDGRGERGGNDRNSGERGERGHGQREQQRSGGQQSQGGRDGGRGEQQPRESRESREQARETRESQQPREARTVEPVAQAAPITVAAPVAAAPVVAPVVTPIQQAASVEAVRPLEQPRLADQPQDSRPFRVAAAPQPSQLPIIDPGHIELSPVEPAQAIQQASAAPGQAPLADFAAAAEALVHRQPDDQPRA